MADILSPTGIEKPLGGELHSRAQYLRNLDRVNQTAMELDVEEKHDSILLMTSTAFPWAANADWDAGPLSIDNSASASAQMSVPTPTFAVAGGLGGTIKFTEPGIYAAIWIAGPSAVNPGDSNYRISMAGPVWPGTPTGLEGLFGQNSRFNNALYFETLVIAPFIRVPVANLEIRLTGKQTNASTNTARVRIMRLGKF